MRNTAVPTISLAALLTACASAPQQPPMDPGVRGQLVADVEAVKAAALRQDRPAAETALAALTRDIAAAQAGGKLDPAKAGAILAAGDRIAEDIQTFRPPKAPPPVVIAVPAPLPAPAPPQSPPGGATGDPKKPSSKNARQPEKSPPEQEDE